jgi:hypothetical protein
VQTYSETVETVDLKFDESVKHRAEATVRMRSFSQRFMLSGIQLEFLRRRRERRGNAESYQEAPRRRGAQRIRTQQNQAGSGGIQKESHCLSSLQSESGES